MAKIRFSPNLLIALLIVAFIVISLLFRIFLPYGQIFVGDDIKYASNDAYYYMRLVDNLSYNFPHLTQFDPYFIFPGGNTVTSLPTFHWITAILAWIGGAGHPTEHVIDIIGVYLPAILGALTVIPVFFIGKTLFNKWVGVLAAGMIAVLPGEFLSRSLLGAGDNPVAEVFFTTTALAFLILAVKTAVQKQLSFSHIFKGDWKVMLKPLIYSLLAGVFLGFYLTTWQGALIFVFIIAIYYIIQFIIDHLKHKSSDYLCIVGTFTFLIAFIILLLNPMSTDVTIATIIALLIPPVLYFISRLISGFGFKEYLYPITLAVIGGLIVIIVYFAAQGVFNTLLAKFNFVFFPTGSTAITTLEMTPMLLPQGDIYTTNVAWGNFSTSIFIAPWWLIFGVGAAAICAYLLYLNNGGGGASLLVFFIITAVVMIILTATQMPSQYTLADDQVKFIPGIAIISMGVLFYSFIRRGKEQPWYISALWVVAILIALSLLVIFTTYSNIRYLAFIPLIILVYILFKQSEGDEQLRLFLIWSLVILMIPMIQRRFQYYLAVNFAVLSGYLSWQIIWLSGIRKLTKQLEETGNRDFGRPEAARETDYYAILGVGKNADFSTIKKAYRRLMQNYRSDQAPKDAATTERIKEINKAYETLTNPQLRASYDGSRRKTSEKKTQKSRKQGQGLKLYYVNAILAIIIVFLFVFCPNISKAQAQGQVVNFAISDDWQAALLWMKDNTPDPMGDPNAYYTDYSLPPGGVFEYPDSAYAVTAWWDYGYWITRVAHRIPSVNPSQSPGPIMNVASFFLSQDKAATDALRQELNSRYIIADYEIIVGKYWAMLNWAGLDEEKYIPTFYIQQDEAIYQRRVFSLEYYRSFIVRLFNFNGQGDPGGKAVAITYQDARDVSGIIFKLVVNAEEFNSYQEALDFVNSQDSNYKYEIVGVDPFISPIPVEPVEDYQLVYSSPTTNNATPQIKIFEYIGDS
ncbi:MAG: DnaJ domain-containing protein [Dehalococcoidales bacterium]|nr:DnaJ domain-containing protein [Dehalococcoidales bacterium]